MFGSYWTVFSSYQFYQVIWRKISNKTETHRYIYESIRIKGCIFNQCYKPKTDPGIGRDFYLTRVWVVISREHSKSKKTLWNANNSLSLLQVCQVLLYSLCLHYILWFPLLPLLYLTQEFYGGSYPGSIQKAGIEKIFCANFTRCVYWSIKTVTCYIKLCRSINSG